MAQKKVHAHAGAALAGHQATCAPCLRAISGWLVSNAHFLFLILGLDAGVLDELNPARVFGAMDGREILDRAAHDFRTDAGEQLLHVGQFQHGINLMVELLNYFGWRSGRRPDGEPGNDIEARISAFCDSGHVRKQRRTVVAADAKRP